MWWRPPYPEYSSSEGEQSYLASAADLMIGLLFVFIIMVAFLALQKQVEQEKVTEEKLASKILQEQVKQGKIEQQKFAVQIAANESKNNQISNDPRGQVTSAIGTEIAKSLHAIQISVESGVITLPEDLLFDLGSSELKSTAINRLGETSKKLGAVLKCFVANQRLGLSCPQNPLGHEVDTIFIEGHTDNRPMNRDGGNTKLSLDRAISVSNALMYASGLSEYRNNQGHPIFSYSAYADKRPLIKSNPADGRNRRVDLRIVLTYRPTISETPVEQVSNALKN